VYIYLEHRLCLLVSLGLGFSPAVMFRTSGTARLSPVPVCSYFSISFIVIASWLTHVSLVVELNLALDETTGGVVTNSVEETVSLNDLLSGQAVPPGYHQCRYVHTSASRS
jgi:hypothetical protein